VLRYPGNVAIADDAVIQNGVELCPCNASARISIGRGTVLGAYTFVYASERIAIGEDCLIAPFVYLVDSDHQIAANRRIREQPMTTAPVRIGNDVWIATGAKILKGVTIGDGAVIAAGAVVNHDVGPGQIVGGIPSRPLGQRQFVGIRMPYRENEPASPVGPVG
jgi:acetyltransferase-like isoleucine patch superfamily enzyme